MHANNRPQTPSRIRLRLHSRNPIAMVAAIRTALRRKRVDHDEISQFTAEAFEQGSARKMRRYCEEWADILIVA